LWNKSYKIFHICFLAHNKYGIEIHYSNFQKFTTPRRLNTSLGHRIEFINAKPVPDTTSRFVIRLWSIWHFQIIMVKYKEDSFADCWQRSKEKRHKGNNFTGFRIPHCGPTKRKELDLVATSFHHFYLKLIPSPPYMYSSQALPSSQFIIVCTYNMFTSYNYNNWLYTNI